jgi:RNA recognition motif-containing protein
MPKKAMGDSQHRGFAFIDFFIEANAKAAFDTLSKSTHIYGRRLVLEWAQKDASVEELREKVSKQYDRQQSGEKSAASGGSSTKKQLKRYFDTESSNKSRGGGEQQGEEEEEDDD